MNNNITEIPVLILLNEWHKHRSPVTLPVFSDGGAVFCFAGLKLLQALGVMKENLVPCNKTVTVIRGSELSCLGWLPITFKIDDDIMTQPAYTCDKVDKIYFSRKSCLKTNILPALFPFPMPSKEQESVQSVFVDSSSVPSHQGMSQILNQKWVQHHMLWHTPLQNQPTPVSHQLKNLHTYPTLQPMRMFPN